MAKRNRDNNGSDSTDFGRGGRQAPTWGRLSAAPSPAMDAAVPQWAALSAPLQECGEIASMRLGQALGEALSVAADRLFGRATEALTGAERELWLDAADFTRVNRLGLVHDFGVSFDKAYLRACQRRRSALAGYEIDFDLSRLRILDDDQIEETVNTALLSQSIQYVTWGSLHQLARGYARLMAVPDLEPMDVPVGPKIIETALTDALKANPWRTDAKQRLIQMLRHDLPSRINLLYRDLVGYMAAIGFVPANALVLPRDVARPPAQSATAAEADPETPGTRIPDPGTRREYAPDPEPEPAPEPAEDTLPPLRLLLERVVPGVWIEYREPGRTPRTMKLAWVSPLRSLFLWTSREGSQAMKMEADDLVAALLEGRVRLISRPAAAPGHEQNGQQQTGHEQRKSA